MSTSGGTIVNAALYALELALAIQLALALAGFTDLEDALRDPSGRHDPSGRRGTAARLWLLRLWPAAVIWLTVAVPSLVQIPFPGLERALRRDPDLIRHHGQVWRVLTSVVVQDGGIGGTIFNLVVLALVAVAAVLVWGPVTAAVLFVAAHLVFNLMATFLSSDVGAGNSGATFGLAATLAGLVLVRWSREKPDHWPLLGRALGVVLIGVVLIVLGDAHGIPMVGGVVLGALAGLVRPPAVHAEPA